MRLIKTMHGWLGVLVLPWVLIIGVTGLYLNHESLVMAVLDGEGYDEAAFESWPDPRPMTPDEALGLAQSLFPGKTLSRLSDTTYHNRDAALFKVEGTQVIVALETGHYWI